MKRLGRREFAKGLAVVTAAAGIGRADARLPSSAQTQNAAPPDQPTASPLAPDQQAKLTAAIEHREAQFALLHTPPLRYDLEPAFVFQVRVAPRSGRKP